MYILTFTVRFSLPPSQPILQMETATSSGKSKAEPVSAAILIADGFLPDFLGTTGGNLTGC